MSRVTLPQFGIVEIKIESYNTYLTEKTMVDSVYMIGMKLNEEYIGSTYFQISSTKPATDFKLEQNYPNPFNPTTKIEYSIPKNSLVTLKVYDMLGREVATLVNEEKSIGNYNVEFNGNGLSSGIYFYKFQAGDYTTVKKMILVK